MTKLMQHAIDELSRLPEDRQDEIAEYILAELSAPVVLNEAQRHAVAEGQADFRAGRIASEAVVEQTFDRLRNA